MWCAGCVYAFRAPIVQEIDASAARRHSCRLAAKIPVDEFRGKTYNKETGGHAARGGKGVAAVFGYRPDGRRVKHIDPIVALTPYIMPMRCDAQVFLQQKLDYEVLARYIVQKGGEGYQFTFMELIIAAYVRAMSQVPEANRFIMNKRLYARTELTTSFALLKDSQSPDIEENTVKIHFDPSDTIYDVSARIKMAIAAARKEEADNMTLRIAKVLLFPPLANFVVSLVRLLDRYGIMPRFLVNASPFHTGLFITNMASIGMPSVNHHIYNFGTTSMFLSLGTVERTITQGPDGKAVRRRMLPVGVVADERICAGATFAKVFGVMFHHLAHPELLEHEPAAVVFDEGNEYHIPKPGEQTVVAPAGETVTI